MVRFCDQEVTSVEYNSISRQELLHYFLNGHLEETVCIYDGYDYIGYTTYYKLLHSISLEAAIIRDTLVLDESIWMNAKSCFCPTNHILTPPYLLPVVDREGNLVSFAYEDDDANRELRQLRELQENPGAVQFADMYPDCECVIIYGFNELAYFFAHYIKAQGIAVQVQDILWEGFFESDEVQIPEYRCMKIYAEGTWIKPVKWKENLLRTVAVEFECVDKIYEENISKGRISDASGNCEELLLKCKEADAVAILGTDIGAQDAYEFLFTQGIIPECFVVEGNNKFGRKIFSKPVYSIAEVMARYGNDIVIIDNYYKNSAWGTGLVDLFDYFGFCRNHSFFLLKDYVQIAKTGLKETLKNTKFFMMGDACLCKRLTGYFAKNDIMDFANIKYVSVCDEEMLREIDRDILCLIVLPEYGDIEGYEQYAKVKKDIVSCLRENGFNNYIDYFSYTETFIRVEQEDKYPIEKWKVKRIIMGSIETCCGSTFLSGLLDSHPAIALIHKSPLGTNIFWLCILLARKDTSEIRSILEKLDYSIYATDRFENREAYIERICACLENNKKYTSREIFIMMHAVLYGKTPKEMEDMIIYWEPHYIERELLEKYVLWLGGEDLPCNIVNLVRNIYIAKGAAIKGILKLHWNITPRACYRIPINSYDVNKENFEYCERMVVKFEDLKCNSKEELYKLCQKWEISWADSLMETTIYGRASVYDNGTKKVKDFDLSPVFNQYEEYFSEFDRFKITLICASWQKEYGYPFIDIMDFSKREIQEFFLRDFRFMEENSLKKEFADEEAQLGFLIGLQNVIRRSLQNTRMLSVINK